MNIDTDKLFTILDKLTAFNRSDIQDIIEQCKITNPNWYNNPENFPVLCWVDDNVETPSNTENTGVAIIISYSVESNFPFGDYSVNWRYATPLTRDEVLKYCLEEKI